ncbi:hypothetical protein [Streptomyces sp. F001]|uniref:hypothetical protein n=1 Tax=Streptomyces sp. F001 TaxID=1510026 RepID=UPI0019D2F451|nr:hypothetical protein [Streptomyces sp. F001]
MCSSRRGLVRGTVLHVAAAVPDALSTSRRTRCGSPTTGNCSCRPVVSPGRLRADGGIVPATDADRWLPNGDIGQRQVDWQN